MLNGEDDPDELDEQELEALREAGVIAPEPKRARRKSHSNKGKHVLFAEDAAEGTSVIQWLPVCPAHLDRVTYSPAICCF